MPAQVHARGSSDIITITPALASFATPYSSADVLGAVNTVTNAVSFKKGTAILESVVAIDLANQKSAIDLLFFDTLPATTVGDDNAALALVDADARGLLGRVSIAAADWVTATGSGNAEVTYKAIGLLVKALAGTQDIYMLAVSRGTPTYGTATDLIIRLGFLQD